jgi:2'-phosphotransferase
MASQELQELQNTKIPKRLDKQSRVLTKFLRHQLRQYRVVPDVQGFISLCDIKKHIPQLKNLTNGELEQIVNTSDKQRFTLKIEGENYFIRANQGHSIESGALISDDETLTRITEPISDVFHGTYSIVRPLIEKNGLNRMSRKHIHMATSIDAKSGKRASCNLLIYIDMALAMADGIKFYISSNGVVLTEGIDGILPSKYLMKFVEILF